MNNLRNRVNLIGVVGMDPEFKSLDAGRKSTRFVIATIDEYKDSEGSKVSETTWHNIIAFDGLADIAMKYIKKGKEVAVEGRISYRSYETKNKEQKYITEIIISDLLLIKSKE